MPTLYLISYDLIGKTERDYERLITTLELLGAREITITFWAVRSTMTPKQLLELLGRQVGPDDRLAVVKAGDAWATRNPITRLKDV